MVIKPRGGWVQYEIFVRFLPFIQGDLVNIFKELHQFGTFMKSLNSTFVVLIVKVEGAKDIKDFIPISVVG